MTQRASPREQRVDVQGPVRKQAQDIMPHGGYRNKGSCPLSPLLPSTVNLVLVLRMSAYLHFGGRQARAQQSPAIEPLPHCMHCRLGDAVSPAPLIPNRHVPVRCDFTGANIQTKLTFEALALHVQQYLGFVLGRVPTAGVALVQCTAADQGLPLNRGILQPPSPLFPTL